MAVRVPEYRRGMMWLVVSLQARVWLRGAFSQVQAMPQRSHSARLRIMSENRSSQRPLLPFGWWIGTGYLFCFYHSSLLPVALKFLDVADATDP